MVKDKRRQYGSGSVHKRKRDGRWVGTIEAGWTKTGARRRITVTAKTEAEAKAKLKKRQRDLTRGDDTTSGRTTVKAWADEWIAATARTARPSTHTTDVGAVRKWIVPTIGHRRLDHLRPADRREVAEAIRAEHATSTARRYDGVLVRMLKAAQAEGHAVPPNVLGVRAPLPNPHDRQAMSMAEAMAVLEVVSARADGSRWVAALVQGMRPAECLGLTWPEVDDEMLTVSWQLQALPYIDKRDRGKGFRVPDGYEARQVDRSLHLVRPKSAAGWRTIPLVPWMASTLAAWRDVAPQSPHGLVWPAHDGSPRRKPDDVAEWHDIQRLAGVQHPSGRPYHRHEIRHTTATLLMELGIPESVRIAIMGHSSIAVTRGYEHADRAMALRALEQVAGRLQLG